MKLFIHSLPIIFITYTPGGSLPVLYLSICYLFPNNIDPSGHIHHLDRTAMVIALVSPSKTTAGLQHPGNRRKPCGLSTIQSRVNYLKGQLSIESQQGLRTTVMMDFLIND